MAKKKSASPKKSTDNTAQVLADIEKHYGCKAMNLEKGGGLDVECITSGSLGVNLALGGKGFPKGRVIEIYGQEHTGKTLLCLKAIAEAQARGETAAFIDVEHASDPKWMRFLGVDTKKLLFFQPDTAEEALGIVEMLCRGKAASVIVLDSVAMLCPKAEFDGSIEDNHVGIQARLIGRAMRKLKGIIAQSGAVALFTNQIRMKIGVTGFGSPYETPGGKALKFQASVRIQTNKISTLKDSKGEPDGMRVRIKVVKCKVAPPYREAEYDVSSRYGLSNSLELLDLGLQRKIVKQSGSYYSYDGISLGQGRENVRVALAENAELAEKLETAILEDFYAEISEGTDT